MPNPNFLLCDTDSLIQLLLTAQHSNNLIPLRMLKSDYGIQPTIVAEVETELMWTRRYGTRFVPTLKKALSNGVIEVLDLSTISRQVGAPAAKSVHSGFIALGQEYSKYADKGEAYTFAAAVTLGTPALSNDKSALDALEFNGMQLPCPVLRVFDLLAISYQVAALGEKECDKIRQELRQLQEHVPRVFKNASFIDGLTKFCPRMLDGAQGKIGSTPTAGPGYAAQIFVSKK
jgi:hypothetical protein